MPPIHVHALISDLGFGGAETLLVDLAAVAPSVDIELSVSFLNPAASRESADQLREMGTDPVLVPFRRLVRLSDHRAVRRHLASVRPDIVHTHLRSADLVGGLAARSLGLPQVSTLHGFDWDPSDWTGARGRVSNALVRAARKRLPRRLIAPSRAIQQGYLEGTGDRSDHVVTMHSGSARTARPGTGAGVRAELGIGPDEFVVAMVSSLHPIKRHDVAIDAVGRLAGRGTEVRLLIVGDGSEDARLRAAAARHAPRTVFAGYRGDVMELLDAADLLLHPSRMEGFPIVLLEAMAARVPILASRVGGIPDIVDDGEEGVLLDPPVGAPALEAAIESLRADPGLRARLAEKGLRRFEERFTVERWARRLRSFYERELELTDARPGNQQRSA